MTATRRFRPKSPKQLHEIEEPPVDAQIAAEFRMERGRDKVALSREADPILVTGEWRARAPGPQDGGGPNEDAVERRVEAIDDEVRLERLPLPPERVAVDRHVHEAEQLRLRFVGLDPRVLREEDAARACAHDRHPLLGRPSNDLIEQAELHEELRDRRALATGDRQRVDVREVLPPAHRDRLAGFAVRLEGAGHRVDVFADVALDADDPDAHRVDLPRRAIKGWRTGRLTVLWIRVSVAPEQLLNDPRERLRIQQPESRARDVAQDDVVPDVGRLPRSQHEIALREHGLAHRRLLQGVRVAFVERHDLEESVEEEGSADAADDGHSDAVELPIERGVLLKRLAVDADLEEAELRRKAAERRHVPVPQRLHGIGGRRFARETGLPSHDGKSAEAGICILSLRNPK